VSHVVGENLPLESQTDKDSSTLKTDVTFSFKTSA
jgi:hypothetical protein